MYFTNRLADYLVTWYDAKSWVTDDAGGSECVVVDPAVGPQVDVVVDDGEVEIHAGTWFRAIRPMPSSSDPRAEAALASWIEDVVLGVAGGGLRELFPDDAPFPTHSSVRTPSGMAVGEPWADQLTDFPAGLDAGDDPQMASVRVALNALNDGRWPAWTFRDPSIDANGRVPLLEQIRRGLWVHCEGVLVGLRPTKTPSK